MIVSSASKRVLLPLIALACLGAQQPRQTAKFTGKSIPDPLGQKEAWAAPGTKLPRFLVRATSALFEQGMADPAVASTARSRSSNGEPSRPGRSSCPSGRAMPAGSP